MSQTRFTLSWNSFQQNICNGLGRLQQNEDFVDMTIAADGHFVKVHQLVLSLASPYFRDLIKSAQCPNPVIFLNKISYTTLCSILEYIYTGEAVVAKENIQDLVEAAKALHIKGLMDMSYQLTLLESPIVARNRCLRKSSLIERKDTEEVYLNEEKLDDDIIQEQEHLNSNVDDDADMTECNYLTSRDDAETYDTTVAPYTSKPEIPLDPLQFQYSVSNQGSLQIILNRFIYYLRYSGKGHRQWRCTDYITKLKCPASVVTKDNIVLRRISAHNHPFHDKKIAKRIASNAIFSVIADAEKNGEMKKKNSISS